MCKKIGEGRFEDCPFWGNLWDNDENQVNPDQWGEIVLHKSGDWDFQFKDVNEVCRVYAAHVDGVPTNFVEFLGDTV